MRSDQPDLTDAGVNDVVIGPDTAYGDQLFIGSERPAYADFEPPSSELVGLNKPEGGLWTSTWKGEPLLSRWVEWAAGEQFYTGEDKGWVLTPKPGTKLAVITSREDYEALVEACPMENDMGKWLLDYGDLQHDYHGVWLTDGGQRETRHMHGNVESLYGWDVESTLWLDWRVAGIEPIGAIGWEEHPSYREL
jgi:hypothetical protein